MSTLMLTFIELKITVLTIKIKLKIKFAIMPPKVAIPQKQYKNIIIQRLMRDKKNHSNPTTNKKSMIHSLKTQCTPNDPDQTEQSMDREYYHLFENFESLLSIQYRPISLKQRKPLKRCLYGELVDLNRIEKQKKIKKISNADPKGSKDKTKKKQSKKKKFVTENVQPIVFETYQDLNKRERNIVSINKKWQFDSTHKLQSAYLSRQKSCTALKNSNRDKQKLLKRTLSKRDFKQFKMQPNKPLKTTAIYASILNKRSTKNF